MTLKALYFIACLSFSQVTMAQTAADDSLQTMQQNKTPQKSKTSFFKSLYKIVQDFSRIDTNYIEPQHYNYAVMLQNTNTYEVYRLINKEGQEVVFSPRPAYKLGPYFGWRWIFLGYTLDLSHLKNADGRRDYNISLYSNQVGVDLFYRKSGKGYRINSVNLGPDFDNGSVRKLAFSGFKSSIKGFNIYYIFNHRKFSYPAAYSQSTVQKRSCGSPIAGIGYTKHSLNIDWNQFEKLMQQHVGQQNLTEILDTTMVSSAIEYTDYSISGGYAYNWVFARNWLFDISLQAGIAYKHSKADTQIESEKFFRNFDLKNFNLDGILRTGVVWNNNKWYVGANSIFHAYNHRKKFFSTNNIFGSVNFYVGLNFGKR